MQVREGRARYTDGDGYLVTASMSIPVVYGDLTGDGSEEAAVPIAVATVFDERRGATATTLEVRVYSSVARPARPTEPDFLGSLRLSDHELVVQQVSIRNGHLVLRGAAGLQPAERSYALHGREFVVVE